MIWKDEKNTSKIKEQLVVDFSTEKVKRSALVADESSSLDEKRRKIELAKAYGEQELKDFEKYTKEYMEKISQLTIFKGLEALVDNLFIETIMYNNVAPILHGEMIPGMPRDMYNSVRKSIYLDLIQEKVNSNIKN